MIKYLAALLVVVAGYALWQEQQSKQTFRSFDSEISKGRATIAKRESQQACNEWVRELTSWKNGKPLGKAKSLAESRTEVDRCLILHKGTDWYDRNIYIKYW